MLSLPALASAQQLRRLDGTLISTSDAEAFARQTLSAHRVTGAQIVVVERGRLVWSFAYGLRSKNPDLPMEAGTTTWAASITKGVFAVYAMQLVERGELKLDQPLAEMLPRALDSYEPYRSTASELVKDPAWRLVTPRHLLSHSSGLLNFAFLESDKKMRLHFAPGSRYGYSGEGFNLLQFAIEQRLGRPLDSLMREAILAPAGMSRTGMLYRPEFEANVADRFDANEAFLAKTRRAPARAAGNMMTSAEDLGRFAGALLSRKLIRARSLRELLKPELRIRTLHQFGPPTEVPGGEADRVGLAYGLGWGLLTKTPHGRAFFKEGHGDGAQNYMICFERRQHCMILLTNSDNGEQAFRPLLERIMGNRVTPWVWEGYTSSR